MLFAGVTVGKWNFFILLFVQVDYFTLFLSFVLVIPVLEVITIHFDRKF
jgi:uncharacterized membrane protein